MCGRYTGPQAGVLFTCLRAGLRRDFYVHLRDWLVETELERYRSGRVFEYMWPVLFGEPAVQAPAEARPQCGGLQYTWAAWQEWAAYSESSDFIALSSRASEGPLCGSL